MDCSDREKNTGMIFFRLANISFCQEKELLPKYAHCPSCDRKLTKIYSINRAGNASLFMIISYSRNC